VPAGDTTIEPVAGCAPVQPPDAVHEVAFELDHVSVAEFPAVIAEGSAVKEVTGAAVVTSMATVLAVVPPGPVHDSV
jgi:hypothetical protein